MPTIKNGLKFKEKQEVSKEPARLILDYFDDGVKLDDVEKFIESVRAFKVMAMRDYADKDVSLYFLPKGLIDAFMSVNPE